MIESESTAPVEESLTSTNDAAPNVPSNDSPSLGADFDAMLGYRAPTVRSEPDDVEAGAPPAPSSASATDSLAAGAPPADATQSTTTDALNDDPFKDATPLTYTVNGQERSDERIKVMKDLGAVIDAKDLPYIQQRLSERDHLFERSQESFQKHQTLEALTSWPKRDETGKVVGTLTGRDAIEASRLDYGNALAKLEAYEALLSDPSRLSNLITFDQEKGEWGLDQDQRTRLAMQIENRQLKLTPQIRQHLASLGVASAAPQGTPTQASTSPSVEPKAAVDQAIAHFQITGLTDDDKALAAEAILPHLRTATAEDVRANPALTLGQTLLDPKFGRQLQHIAKLRSEAARQVDAATTAQRANAPKLAAALAHRPNAPRPVVARQPVAANDDELTPEEEAFARFERAGAAGLRARSA